MAGQGMIPENDVIIAFSIKELFVEIRDEIKAMSVKMDDKASVVDLMKVEDRITVHDTRLAENDSKWAGLRGYMLGAAVGGGVLSGGMIAGLSKLLG